MLAADEFSRSSGKIGGGWWDQIELAKKLRVPQALDKWGIGTQTSVVVRSASLGWPPPAQQF
jgi:hypothetical protein